MLPIGDKQHTFTSGLESLLFPENFFSDQLHSLKTTHGEMGDAEATPSPTLSAEASHHFGALNTLLLVTLLMLSVVSGYLLKQFNFHYLPESGASMLIGIVAGGFVRLIYGSGDELEFLKFQPELFFFVLLPPIIFEAGYTLKKKRFFANFFTILLFAVGGTLISTFIVGFLVFAAAEGGVISVDGLLQSLLFGALISAVDPVATLAIIGNPEMKCDPLLYSLVFGESVLNDAVAIVLFHVFNNFAGGNSFQCGDIAKVLLEFVGVCLGSVAIGVACGLLCAFIFKRTSVKLYHTYEMQLLFLFAFGCFALAELAGLSGVMSIFFCGITMAHYNFYNLSPASKISSTYVFEAFASLSETCVFTYMGMSLLTASAHWEPGFIALALLLCLVGRACNIFPLAWLANCRRKNKIPLKMQFVMFFAGLRGAVAYALSMQLSDKTGNQAGIEVIQTTTLAIVVCSTFILGGTTSPVLECVGMKNRSAGGGGGGGGGTPARLNSPQGHSPQRRDSDGLREDLHREAAEEDDFSHGGRGRSGSSPALRSNLTLGFWQRFDERFMKPLFGGRARRLGHGARPSEPFVLIGSDDSADLDETASPSIHSWRLLTFKRWNQSCIPAPQKNGPSFEAAT